jgi:hypothetical protein
MEAVGGWPGKNPEIEEAERISIYHIQQLLFMPNRYQERCRWFIRPPGKHPIFQNNASTVSDLFEHPYFRFVIKQIGKTNSLP